MLCVVLLVVSLMMGCSTNPMIAIYDNEQKIASDTNSYNLDEVEQTLENGHFVASAEKMEGMDTIWTFESEDEKSVDITYSINVTSGKLKMVLINSNGEVHVISECDYEMDEPIQEILDVGKGNNRIKIVAGKNTKFDIDISIPEGEFKELG